MRKIPTLFARDFTEPSDGRYVTREPNPECQWVFDGEGVATRKYDGTCMLYRDDKTWWARREVRAGKTPPPNFEAVSTDEATGKTVGWEPVAQSAFAKYHAQALGDEGLVADWPDPYPVPGQTYEMVGPKVNGNPEQVDRHLLIRHGYLSSVDAEVAATAGRSYDELAAWLADHPAWEGIVWHHPDGRMAKLKRRDIPTA